MSQDLFPTQYIEWSVPNFRFFYLNDAFVVFGVYARSSEELIATGEIGRSVHPLKHLFGARKSDPQNWITIAYHVRSDSWGQGIAPEIASALIQTAFTQVEPECAQVGECIQIEGVTAFAVEENARSQRVLEKCGLRFVGVHRSLRFSVPISRRYYAIARGEWEEQRRLRGLDAQ
jgi:RimJ/RimL family protein N-acetyltransferase